MEVERYRWNIAGIAVVLLLYILTYSAVPQPGVRFTVYLVLFTLWMAWFVVTSVKYLKE